MLLARMRQRFTLAVISMLFLTMLLPLNTLPSIAFAKSKPVHCHQGKLCSFTTASHKTPVPKTASHKAPVPRRTSHKPAIEGSFVTLNPPQGPAGTQVTGTGGNWSSGDSILVQWEDGTILATTTVQGDGTFTVSFTIPSDAPQGGHTIYFTDQTAGYFIPTTFTVGPCPSSSLTVQTVWTRDGNGNNNSNFTPGDAIQYAVYVNNSCTVSINTTFQFEDYWETTNDVDTQIFDWTFKNITVPVGLSGWYTQWTVPTDALTGPYTDKVSVWDQDNTQNQNTGYGSFTVMGKLVIPSTGKVTTPFLEQPNAEAWFSNYYDKDNNLRNTPSGGAHSGVDIAEPNPPTTNCTTGLTNPVYAAGGGRVIFAGWAGFGFGWSVVVRQGYGFRNNGHYTYTLYGHMGTPGGDSTTSQSCLQVSVGTHTDKTTLLGYQGMSGGTSTGIHLHFTILATDQNVAALSSDKDLIPQLNQNGMYPASPDFYTCMQLTAGDPSPQSSVNYQDNNCS